MQLKLFGGRIILRFRVTSVHQDRPIPSGSPQSMLSPFSSGTGSSVSSAVIETGQNSGTAAAADALGPTPTDVNNMAGGLVPGFLQMQWAHCVCKKPGTRPPVMLLASGGVGSSTSVAAAALTASSASCNAPEPAAAAASFAGSRSSTLSYLAPGLRAWPV